MNKIFQSQINFQRSFFYLVFLLLTQTAAFAQISGTVSSTSGEKLPGASVAVKNTSIGTITDEAGRYSIEYQPITRYKSVIVRLLPK